MDRFPQRVVYITINSEFLVIKNIQQSTGETWLKSVECGGPYQESVNRENLRLPGSPTIDANETDNSWAIDQSTLLSGKYRNK